MIENKKMTKREFLAHLGLVSGAAFIAAKTLVVPAFAQEKRRGAKPDAAPKKDTDLPWADPKKPPAKPLAYHPNHQEAEKDPATDAKSDKGVPWKERFCHSCSFYTGVGKKDGTEAGKCTVIPNALVNHDGICNSWTKKV